MSEHAYRRPPHVAVVDEAASEGGPPTVYIARVPDGPLLVLEGSAALIWRAAVSSAAGSDVGDRVAAEVGVAAAEIREEVENFLVELISQGLLEPVVPEGESTAPQV